MRKSESSNRALVVGLILIIALGVILLLSLVLGAAGFAPGMDQFTLIVWKLRLPRVLLAFGVGGLLGVAGAYMQCLFRNPLADPYITGVSAGAGLGAVIALSILPFSWMLVNLTLPVAAFIGGLAITALLLSLMKYPENAPLKLLLLGMALGTLAASAMAFILLRFPEKMLKGALYWLYGSLSGASWPQVIIAFIVLAAGLAWGLSRHRTLDALMMGPSDAHNLGVNVSTTYRALLGIAALMTSIAVAFAGIVAFVGLVVPHSIRVLTGASHGRLLVLSMLAGMALVGLVDLIARTAMSPGEIPLSIITSLIGAPFFIILLLQSRGRTLE
jgi:iron complex transport system permease protein